MTSDREGKYNTAYTFGLERISVDNLNVEDSFKEEPLFYLYAGRGNTTELTDNRGVARDRYRYDPYAAPIPKATIGPNPWYTENPYRYNGEDYDINTGLQYLRARYYEPSTGRFLSRDSYLGNVMEPLSLNRYIYVKNNPIMYNDPSGNIPLLAITAGIGALAGAVYGGVTSYRETGSIDWKKVGKDALIGGAAGLALGEAKFGSSQLGQTKDGLQMSDDWLKGSDRILKAVNGDEDLANEITKALNKGQVERVLSKVDGNGNVVTYRLDGSGKIVGTWP